ncbi:hypothetical protein LMG23992_03454 [Cupriavidus laharis]|uniref:Glycosyl transferase family 1 domain-containing protein n=1 Tax=Cupriavidus laharis TaxID=151654 RepID=A0ABN7YXV9_9BURK|nr:glycosyltransferase family 4 protein [Cupriavidus laharis]CAG9177256.1 hypothetical protein LMG23992_03454 [Cupriavidus laharis]
MLDLWFWQRIVTPHMAGLVSAIAARGHEVHYVAEEPISAKRADLGWDIPDLGKATLHLLSAEGGVSRLASQASPSSIHVCQGMRGNGYVSVVQRLLAESRLRQWVVMETVNDSGWLGAVKRLEYSRLLRTKGRAIEGILASGHATARWLIERGAPATRVYPFAYFLSGSQYSRDDGHASKAGIRFIFVGKFIKLKRLKFLITTLSKLKRKYDFELTVIGSGPLEESLRSEAMAMLPGRVRWVGRVRSPDIPALMATADCLVLPSTHDGWGAVVSEALMVGTPAICTDTCGAAEAVRYSTVGGVFGRDDAEGLLRLLERTIQAGPVHPDARRKTAAWAQCLSAEAGADYLAEILTGDSVGVPPWRRDTH